MRAPVIQRIVHTHDEQRGRETVRECAVMADDGRGDDAAVGRIAGAWIDDVVIGRAVLLKITLIAARCDHRFIRNLHHRKVFTFVVRVLHSNTPFAAVRLAAERLHVAAERDDAARDAVFAEYLHHPVGCVALCDTAEVDLHIIRNGRSAAVELHLRVIDVREQGGQLRRVGHAVLLRREAPRLHDRLDGAVENAAGRGRDLERTGKQRTGILVQRGGVVAVERVNVAALTAD